MQLLQSIVEATQNVAETLQSADSSGNDSWLAWFFGGSIDYHASRLVASFIFYVIILITGIVLLSGSGEGWLIWHIANIGNMATEGYFLTLYRCISLEIARK